jgi:hypothetical protein
MIRTHDNKMGLRTLTAALALFCGLALARSQDLSNSTVNIDFNGARNVPGPRGPGPTYVGVGAGGGGTVWNGVLADSQLDDGTDDDNINVAATNLLNSAGAATTIGFSISPVGGDDASGGSDPNAPGALFGDEIFVGAFGQSSGIANFTITGLGADGLAHVYFYFGSAGNFSIPGASASSFAASGIFTPGNTVYFGTVPVTNGTITGTMGTGAKTELFGMTIQTLPPQPFVLSASPSGADVTNNAAISIQLQDYVSQVNTNSIQLLVNGTAVAATVGKSASITTVTYVPASNWADGSTNTYRIIFADNSSTPIVQTNDFTFLVFNTALAAATINIDFNGASGSELLGATYIGVGMGGGGNVFNGILADSRPSFNLVTPSGTNLLNSLGQATAVGFTMGQLIGDNPSAQGVPANNILALVVDYLVSVPSFASYPGPANFTISGLGAASNVDVFLISHLNGQGITLAGASPAPFVARPGGASTFVQSYLAVGGQSSYLYYWPNVPVTNGVVTGVMDGGSSSIVMDTMTIQAHVALPILPLTLNSSFQSNALTLSWLGRVTLQAASNLLGPWIDLATTSPRIVQLSGNDGLFVYEAEHFDSQSTGTGTATGEDWVFSSSPTNAGGDASVGWSGTGAMQALPNSSANLNLGSDTTDGPRMNYNINITDPGTYYVWVRGFGDSAPGPSTDDSLFMGMDGAQFGGPITGFAQGGGYVWSSGGGKSFTNLTAGVHVVNIAMRETGMIVDKVILTKNASYVPAGMGPTEGPPESRPLVVAPIQFYRLKQ